MFSRAESFVLSDRGYHEIQFCGIILNFDQWLRMRCRLIFYLELWQPLYSVEQTHLCNFCRIYNGNIHMKLFAIWTSGSGGDVV